MKVVLAAVLLLSSALCRAQDGRDIKSAPDEAYTARLIRLVEGLQKNPWRGWKAGTVVVVRYLDDAPTGVNARVQPGSGTKARLRRTRSFTRRSLR
jgi:hypothetical protein